MRELYKDANWDPVTEAQDRATAVRAARRAQKNAMKILKDMSPSVDLSTTASTGLEPQKALGFTPNCVERVCRELIAPQQVGPQILNS